jgi:hypothetical protein
MLPAPEPAFVPEVPLGLRPEPFAPLSDESFPLGPGFVFRSQAAKLNPPAATAINNIALTLSEFRIAFRQL